MCTTRYLFSFHDGYGVDRLTPDFYDRESYSEDWATLEKVFAGDLFIELDADEDFNQKIVETLGLPSDNYVGTPVSTCIIYRFHYQSQAAAEDYVQKFVDMMLKRVPLIDEEDHHEDFYYSHLELLAQMVRIVGGKSLQLTLPLREAILSRESCDYCDGECNYHLRLSYLNI